MSRATPIQNQKIARSTARWKPIAIIIVTILAALVVAYVIVASLFPPAVKIQPESGSRDVPVGEELKISTSWMRGTVKSVTVREISLDPLGNAIGDRIIEGQLVDGVFLTGDGSPLLKPDARYEVTAEADLTELTASGPERRSVTEQANFQTIITPAPVFMKDTQVVPLGEPIIVEFNTPVIAFDYKIAPEINATVRIDEENPTRALISFDGYEQGQKFQLTITGAVAENGSSLQHPYTQTIATTDPLIVVFVPGDGEAGVSQSERPTLNFSEDIKNKELFESLVSMEPATLGGWDWLDDKTVEFKPLQNWAQGAQIKIHLKGGPEGIRGVSGSFVRQDVESSFTTKPSKMIDVNLTTQTLTMYDNDQAVKSFLVSSGSQATPSLTGTYAVYHKAEKVTMRGEGYVAPDVPWVLMFNGDYTIHGNYWATAFGVPSSHGCVGLPVGDAEYLYNWTPVGTIVSIHY